MSEIWSAIAKLIESLAGFGAGTVSNGVGYEPELPAELLK